MPEAAAAIVRKQNVTQDVRDFEFVLSDATVDRYGDVIEASGWQLADFSRNPIALFNHNPNHPIGRWVNVRVEKGMLKGQLVLADEGTSLDIDKVRKLVDQGVLKATSVGFKPIKREPLESGRGERYLQQELLECSLVSVPANPNALQIARSLQLSDATQRLVFGVPAERTPAIVTRGSTGVPAATPPGITKMDAPSITTLIENAQTRLLGLRDQLQAAIADAGDEPDETNLTVREQLKPKIEVAERNLASLQDAERQLATGAVARPTPAANGAANGNGVARVFAQPAAKDRPGEHYLRTIVGMAIARGRGDYSLAGIERAIAERYGQDGNFDEKTKIVLRVLARPENTLAIDALPGVVQRAASAPADMATSGWASQLVYTQNAEFMTLLMPASVYPGLAARGIRLSFGRAGVISIPTRLATPTIAGAFVVQGAAIPVKQGAFSAVTLSPKKLGVISTFTRELALHSTPSIEDLIRNAMQEDTSVVIDGVLLGAVAATTAAPGGIRAGVAKITATAGGGFAALVGDLKALVGALITASNGNVRAPTWIMNPIQALSISVTANAGGDFPFAAEMNQNRFQGYPVILSTTCPAGTVILIDAADFVSVEGDAPMFSASDQATLHMEDTTPLPIATGAQGSGVLATPTRSLYQTDSIAIRMTMDLNWALRRTGVIAWTDTITW